MRIERKKCCPKCGSDNITQNTRYEDIFHPEELEAYEEIIDPGLIIDPAVFQTQIKYRVKRRAYTERRATRYWVCHNCGAANFAPISQRKNAAADNGATAKNNGRAGKYIGERNINKDVNDYLSVEALSRDFLLSLLECAGYSSAEAARAVDNRGIDWNEQAVKRALSCLDVMAFSRQGLINMLKRDRFTVSEAIYGADNCGADWNEQAVRKAKLCLDAMAFSRQELVNQLKRDRFTPAEAEYAANAVKDRLS